MRDKNGQLAVSFFEALFRSQIESQTKIKAIKGSLAHTGNPIEKVVKLVILPPTKAFGFTSLKIISKKQD